MANSEQDYYLGVMSGTSCDGIDIACLRVKDVCDSTVDNLEQIAFRTYDYSEKLHRKLLLLNQKDPMFFEEIASLDFQVSQSHVSAIERFFEETGVDKKRIKAIGLHGHTLIHHKDGKQVHSWQIGDGTYVAQKIGVGVVDRCRQTDTANGGQGAPLAPIFHQILCAKDGENNLVLNMGGIANITMLYGSKMMEAFDTGPSNTLSDLWMRKKYGQTFDEGGKIACSGTVNASLLDRLKNDPYFDLPPPKSTGKELFNEHWLIEKMLDHALPNEDVLATINELSAWSIARAIPAEKHWDNLWVCGGGKHNHSLLGRVRDHLLNGGIEVQIVNSMPMGIESNAVEAAAWSWFAYLHLHHISVDLRGVTGAHKPAILGAYSPAFS